MEHDWALYRDRGMDWDGDSIDLFAGLDEDFHNGPLCRRCGRSGVCHHCHPELWDEVCPGA